MFITVTRHARGLMATAKDERYEATINVDRIIGYVDLDDCTGCRIRLENREYYEVRETPAEIMALIAAEHRKRDRLMLAGQILATTAAIGDYAYRDATVGDVIPDYIGNAVACADALLAALDATEGE